ncbi:MAG: hypothetical protein JKY30_09065 [Flavobacteriales bacterium]|nr:hypothetical protein [Flavobacteriales bacterium]
MLEAVDEKVGRLMQVDELQVIDNNQYWGQQNRNVVSNSVMSYSKTRGSYIENVPEIKLRYEVKTKFEID